MTRTERLALWIGGLVVGVAAVGGVAYAATHKPPPVVGPTGMVFQPGRSYLIAAPIPSGITTAAALAGALSAQGTEVALTFSNVVIVYFGPQGVLNANVPIPFTVQPTMYVATVTFSGQSAAAVPAGMSVVAL